MAPGSHAGSGSPWGLHEYDRPANARIRGPGRDLSQTPTSETERVNPCRVPAPSVVTGHGSGRRPPRTARGAPGARPSRLAAEAPGAARFREKGPKVSSMCAKSFTVRLPSVNRTSNFLISPLGPWKSRRLNDARATCVNDARGTCVNDARATCAAPEDTPLAG